jgi:PBP1b-binding outer membrane lipoprotein LpoB
MKRSSLRHTILIACLAGFLAGCSDDTPKPVTEGADQAAIEAYKAKERELEMESMQSMKGDKELP